MTLDLYSTMEYVSQFCTEVTGVERRRIDIHLAERMREKGGAT